MKLRAKESNNGSPISLCEYMSDSERSHSSGKSGHLATAKIRVDKTIQGLAREFTVNTPPQISDQAHKGTFVILTEYNQKYSLI